MIFNLFMNEGDYIAAGMQNETVTVENALTVSYKLNIHSPHLSS